MWKCENVLMEKCENFKMGKISAPFGRLWASYSQICIFSNSHIPKSAYSQIRIFPNLHILKSAYSHIYLMFTIEFVSCPRSPNPDVPIALAKSTVNEPPFAQP
jgi:hypothetical protein